MSSGPVRGLPQVDIEASFVMVLPATVGGDAVACLCAELRTRLQTAPDRVVVCDAGALAGCGLAAVDLLARLELTARRAGGRMRIRDPAPDLSALLLLTGIGFELDGAAAPCGAGSSPGVGAEVERQPEGGENPGGVQERGQPDDPAS